ncbi:hypothetical protein WNY63_12890 [Pseudoalteromonas neustonica]|uniref:CsbD family protein n=1 Tax=Pseudoalteromonas neustonica TaxID=1840331 RepID=A0ABU9U3L0_9GAMM
MKDLTVADAIKKRGGGAGQVNQVSCDLQAATVGDIANRAASGDKAARTALKLIKQAKSKKDKYGNR